jgi:hypothetical protein
VDTFVFTGNFGTDTVTDFTDGTEKLDLDAGITFASLTITQLDVNGDRVMDARVTTSTGQIINVLGTQGQSAVVLTADDFLF